MNVGVFCIVSLSVFMLPIALSSRNYIDDTLAVRAILDSKGLRYIPADSVGDSANERICSLC